MAKKPMETPPEEDLDGQSTRPANWTGIPPPDQEHQDMLSTHAETRDEPAEVTRAQRELEQEEEGERLEWEDPEEQEKRDAARKEQDDITPPLV